MATISFNRKTFEKEIGKLDEKMQERISLFGTPIENITENELQIEIFPNRPDLLSFQSFARTFKAFLGKETGLKNYKIEKYQKDYYVIVDKSVETIRPFIACAIIKDITFDDEKIKEIIEMQEKLHTTMGRKRKKIAIGLYPLKKIKFPITFKALEPDKIKFIPLGFKESFTGFQILQRHPTGREYSHLIAQKTKFPIFIDSNNEILSMPPIINSELTGKIETSTKDIFIECSGFDLNTLKKCLNILVTTFADMGGKIYPVEIHYKKKEITPNLSPEEWKIGIQKINKLLGLDLNEKQTASLLERMGHSYKNKKVLVPAFRVDILHEVDLIEDIAIAYGYENFPQELPKISTIGKENKIESVKQKISEILVGKEFLEISNYHLTTKDDQYNKMGEKSKNINILEIKDAKTNYNVLRENLSHYLLKTFSENSDSEYPQKIFELGKIFNSNPNSNILLERESLSIGIAPGNFTELRQVLEYLILMLNIEIKIEPTEDIDYCIDGRVGKIMINKKEVGHIGEIHPRILKNWKIKMPISILEIDLEEIFNKFNQS